VFYYWSVAPFRFMVGDMLHRQEGPR